MEFSHLFSKERRFSKQSEVVITPSDQKPREAKSVPYTRVAYETVLAKKGSFMVESDLGITDASKSVCRNLLGKEQTVPQDSLFRDDIFRKACEKVKNRNEARVLQDITRLIVPSAETLATYRATHLDILIESVNEGWNSGEPFYGPRPQPDYSVGFRSSAFTNHQLEKLEPYASEVSDTSTSWFMATPDMYFPFLTCEVKCSSGALDVADRQNAHSMTLAVRGVVGLFSLAGREKELHREIVAFSTSHDNSVVRIYGHYPMVDVGKATFYRHELHQFVFKAQEGKEKWMTYKFVKNVYDIWMPTHLKRIRSVIDAMPGSGSGKSGLSQVLESHDH